MATLRSTASTSNYEDKPLLPKGLYTLTLTKVGDPQPSTFVKKNGDPAADFAFLTFSADDQGGDFMGEFDCVYPWEMWVQFNQDGTRKRVASLQELVEAFLDREIETDEEIDFDADIVRPRRKALGTVVVAMSKDGKKSFNKIESILPMPRKRRPAAPAPDANAFDQVAQENGHEVVGGVVRPR